MVDLDALAKDLREVGFTCDVTKTSLEMRDPIWVVVYSNGEVQTGIIRFRPGDYPKWAAFDTIRRHVNEGQ